MDNKHSISILRDYSEYPGPRYRKHGKNSGEDFYYNLLNKKFAQAVTDNSVLEVILDGTSGYASSFIDESFGNLINDFGVDLVKKYLKIISIEEPDWINMITNETFIQWESRRKKGDKIRVSSINTEPWYKYINGKMELQIWKDNLDIIEP